MVSGESLDVIPVLVESPVKFLHCPVMRPKLDVVLLQIPCLINRDGTGTVKMQRRRRRHVGAVEGSTSCIQTKSVAQRIDAIFKKIYCSEITLCDDRQQKGVTLGEWESKKKVYARRCIKSAFGRVIIVIYRIVK